MSNFIKINLADRKNGSITVERYNINRLETSEREGICTIYIDSENYYEIFREITDKEYDRLVALLTAEDEDK